MKRLTPVIALLGMLTGCATPSAETVRLDVSEWLKPHPRALMFNRSNANCVFWCTSTISVINSEGVKATGNSGAVNNSETGTASQATSNTANPSMSVSPSLLEKK